MTLFLSEDSGYDAEMVCVCLFTHREQRGPCGAGLVWYALLSCEDVLEVLPHLFVEDHMEEEDEDSLRRKQNRCVINRGVREMEILHNFLIISSTDDDYQTSWRGSRQWPLRLNSVLPADS